MAYGGINASGVFVAPIAPFGSFGVFIVLEVGSPYIL
jgi:hypothetical protein